MRVPWTGITAAVGLSGVALGAFGAHALKSKLGAANLAVWNTAVTYHLLHAVALLALTLYGRATGRVPGTPLALFTAGIALFSGSLYLLALTGWGWLGPVTPIGGLAFLVGWLSLLAIDR